MQETPLAALAGYRNGFAFKPDDRGVEGLPIVRIEQLLNPSVEPDLFAGEVPATNRIDDGDLIFSWSGTLAVRFWTRGPAYLNQHLFRVDPRPGVDRLWLRWALEEAVGRMKPLMHGSAMTHITRRVLEEVRVPLPPEPVQRKIADYLDAETARIEALAAKNEALRALVAERLAAGIEERLWGLAESDVPLQYRARRLTVGIVVRPAELMADEGPPFLRGVNIRPNEVLKDSLAYIDPVANDLNEKSKLQAGDVLMVRTGAAGVSAVIPSWAVGGNSSGLLLIRPDRRVVNSHFLAYALNSGRAKEYIQLRTQGAIQQSFATSELGGIPVPNVPLDVQQAVVGDVRGLVARAERVTRGLQQQSTLLTERRQALITAAVTGELEV